jgi:DNA polymerase phi
MDGEDDEEPEPATVLIDLLLELLHRPSAFVKSVSQTVFTGFADEIGEQAMELLLEQIRPDEAEEAGDEDDEDASMANGDASTSKSPVKAGKGKGKKAVVETVPDSDDDDNNDEDDSDGDDEIDEDFRNELLAALQANGVADEFDAAEENDEDSDEELLDDDQMMALDDKLADIFRLQGGGKKGKKGASQSRVLSISH